MSIPDGTPQHPHQWQRGPRTFLGSRTGLIAGIPIPANQPNYPGEGVYPRQLHNPSFIVEDIAASYDFARPCFLKAQALFKEIEVIIQLVVCKLGEAR